MLGSGAFGRQLAVEGGALMNGVSVPTKEVPESSLALSTLWRLSKSMIFEGNKSDLHWAYSLRTEVGMGWGNNSQWQQ